MATPFEAEVVGVTQVDLEAPAFSYYRRLGRVRRFVLEHYAEPITLADASRAAGMERTAFSDFFHRKTGLRYREFVAAIRVVKAMQLMAESNLPVCEVGRRVGYRSVRTFERVFQRVAGCPPIQCKRSVRRQF